MYFPPNISMDAASLMEGGFQNTTRALPMLKPRLQGTGNDFPNGGLRRGLGSTAWLLFVLFFLGSSAGLEAQVELPSSFYDTTVFLSSSVVRFNQVGSNRVEGAASSTILTWTKEADAPFGMATAFSVSTENIDVESPTINIACGRYFYIESASQQPVTVQMTVKGRLNLDYKAALKPDRNLGNGAFAGIMRGSVDGGVGGEVVGGFRMEKVGAGNLPKLETDMGMPQGGVPFEYKLTNLVDFTTNILVNPNMRCFARVDVSLWHYRNDRYPEVWEYQKFSNSGDLALELAIDPSDTSNSRIIMGIARPDLSFEYKAGQMIMKYTGVLQAADALEGPFVDVPNAQSPYTDSMGSGRFFRARF